MLLVIFLVLLLLLVLVQLPGRFLIEQVGVAAQVGPRDDLPSPTRILARSRRALANFQETLPIFLVLAVLSLMFAEQSWLSLAGAWVYFVARCGHAWCYLKGLTPWRSVCFLLSLVGLVGLAVPLIPHIWG